ncbi:zinc finger protein 62-like [Macrobrachium nipponense]|uniref:zinc finger protein 62-like n=1 Tax=Macrobrachium nipponense TaxID=159736 RepID=UPI0030C7FFFE
MIRKKTNECPKCGKIYMLPSSLKTHLLCHVNDDKHTCPECLKVFKTEVQLKEHISSHLKTSANFVSRVHNGQMLSKMISNQTLTKGDSSRSSADDLTGACLKELVRIYRRLLKCPRCPMTFFVKSDLENHLASHSYDNRVCVGFSTEFSGIHESVLTKPGSSYVHKSTPSILLQESKADRYNTSQTLHNSDRDESYYDSHQIMNNKESEVIVIENPKTVVCKELRTIAQSDETSKYDKNESEISSNEKDFISQGITIKVENSNRGKDYNVENGCVDASCNISGNITPTQDCNSDCFSLLSETELENYKSIVSQMSLDSESLSKSECGDCFVTDTLLDKFPCLIESKVIVGSGDRYGVVEATICEDYCTLFKCIMCPMIILGKNEIEFHVQSHTEEVKVNENCTRRQENSEKVRPLDNSSDSNYENDHKSLVVKTKGGAFKLCLKKVYQKYYKCMKCPMVFLTKSEVLNHKIVHVPDKKLYRGAHSQNGVSVQNDEKGLVPVGKVGVSNETQRCDLNSAVYYPVFQCSVCEVMFLSRAELNSHLAGHKLENFSDGELKVACGELKNVEKVNSTSRGSEKCKFQVSSLFCIPCNKKFDKRKKYFDHMRLHRSKKYKCKVCDKKFRANSYLRKHMQVHSRPFSCIKCNKSFKSDYVLELHEALHSEARPYKCSKCGSAFRNKISLNLHNFDHMTNNTFTCEVCKNMFENSHLLNLHMKTHLEDFCEGETYKCSKCDLSFSDRNDFEYHLQSHLVKKPFKCQYCNKRFSEKQQYTCHQKLHTRGLTHHCCTCKRSFSSRYALTNHMDTHSSNKQYLCYICGASLVHRSSYYSHMKKHTGVKEHHCELCEKKFYHKGSFKRHMSMHFGKKPYHCEVCNKSFKQSAHLKSHMIFHSGEKPHQCTICFKSFTQKSSLKVHHLTHSGGPYKCTDCSRTFTQKIALLNHLKCFGKSYPCNLCLKTFTRRSCFVYHKKGHLLGTCVINFDGHDIETFNVVDEHKEIIISEADEHKEIIISEIDMCDAGEEIVDAHSVNVDITESEDVIIESHEAAATLDPHEFQSLTFSCQETQGFDLSNLSQTFVFRSPEDHTVNPCSIVSQADLITLDVDPFDAGCDTTQEVHFKSDGSNVITVDNCESETLSLSSPDPHVSPFT